MGFSTRARPTRPSRIGSRGSRSSSTSAGICCASGVRCASSGAMLLRPRCVRRTSSKATRADHGDLRVHARMPEAIDYLNPALPANLARVVMPVIDATPAALEGYGRLVADPVDCRIEIVQWPALGPPAFYPGTGGKGGTAEGVFVSEWRGDILYGRNEAVGGHYILAYAEPPETARED